MATLTLRKAAFWLALLLPSVLALLPTDMLPAQMFSLWDKAQHALGFACLTLLALAVYPARWRIIPWLLLAHGGLIELLQAATGWRSGDWLDLLADGVGILLISAAWWWIIRRQITGVPQGLSQPAPHTGDG